MLRSSSSSASSLRLATWLATLFWLGCPTGTGSVAGPGKGTPAVVPGNNNQPGNPPGGTTPPSGDALTITFLDIGQGDSALIVSPTGKRVLIDGGPPDAADRLVANLQQRGIDSLDLIILSHPHMDHLGGLTKVVKQLPVRMYLDGGYPSTSPGYTALLEALQTRGVAVKQANANRNIDLGGGAELLLLGPPSPWLQNTRSDVNANSVVARLTYRQRVALFTGDSEPETERWLLDQYANNLQMLHAEVLKTAHHGGRFSSTSEFLKAVQPSIAVISVGAHNDYGHPTPQAMERLGQVGARIYRTDQYGDVTVRSEGGQPWQVTTAHPATSDAGPTTPPPNTAPPHPTPPATPTAASGYIASERSDVFHRASCPAAARIVAGNQIHFETREAAVATGRRPAADCKP